MRFVEQLQFPFVISSCADGSGIYSNGLFMNGVRVRHVGPVRDLIQPGREP